MGWHWWKSIHWTSSRDLQALRSCKSSLCALGSVIDDAMCHVLPITWILSGIRCKIVEKSVPGNCIIAFTSNCPRSLMSVLSGWVTYSLNKARLAGKLYESCTKTVHSGRRRCGQPCCVNHEERPLTDSLTKLSREDNILGLYLHHNPSLLFGWNNSVYKQPTT